ncbi:type II secretion system protein N [Neptunomonas phycophila]|uniref:type II secretion system protein N n=1 Tax=Neptunomonas phycophila TaxID=1572645 RepID=UPI0023F886E3|nr:type II secretion system protein N [Neptunomonas phycophila]
MKRIIVLLMFIFIISFGISTPAHFLYSLVDDQLQGAELTNIEGSIWQGEADLSVGNMDTGKVTWRFSPMALLTGGLGWNFTLINESVTGFAAAKVWSLSTLSSLAINTNTQHLAQWNPLLNTISSDVSAQLEQVSADQKQVQKALSRRLGSWECLWKTVRSSTSSTATIAPGTCDTLTCGTPAASANSSTT